jgi:hypothetical protein
MEYSGWELYAQETWTAVRWEIGPVTLVLRIIRSLRQAEVESKHPIALRECIAYILHTGG